MPLFESNRGRPAGRRLTLKLVRPGLGPALPPSLNGELYLKRLTIARAGQVRMENAHFDYDPLVIHNTDDVQMIGEVVGCQRTVRASTNRPIRVRTHHR